MAAFPLRIGHSKAYYPNIARIFGLGYYRSLESGEDEFSKKLMLFYKFGKDPQFFVDNMKELYRLKFQDDAIIFDSITVYPTHEKDTLNGNMVSLAKSFPVHYNQIIRRTRTINSNHGLKSFKERIENIKDSIEITADVKGKNIIILDNATTTGSSLIDATNLLLEKGAKNVVCICLGLSEKEKESDWGDINKTLKYSRIINLCNSPFVSKEKREEWKKNKS